MSAERAAGNCTTPFSMLLFDTLKRFDNSSAEKH
jgi:hypothetical protein